MLEKKNSWITYECHERESVSLEWLHVRYLSHFNQDPRASVCTLGVKTPLRMQAAQVRVLGSSSWLQFQSRPCEAVIGSRSRVLFLQWECWMTFPAPGLPWPSPTVNIEDSSQQLRCSGGLINDYWKEVWKHGDTSNYFEKDFPLWMAIIVRQKIW